jgi:hypothetical protein
MIPVSGGGILVSWRGVVRRTELERRAGRVSREIQVDLDERKGFSTEEVGLDTLADMRMAWSRAVLREFMDLVDREEDEED